MSKVNKAEIGEKQDPIYERVVDTARTTDSYSVLHKDNPNIIKE